MNGKLKDWSFSRTGESVLTITTRESCKRLWDALGDQEITFSIKKRVIPRSLNANNYAWSLIEKLAVAVKSDKDSVYEEMLRRYGTGETYTDEAGNECKVLFSLREGVPPALVARHYAETGVGYVDGKKFIHYRAIKGTSEYSTKEMSVFLDGIISECQEVGIETDTPEQIARYPSISGRRLIWALARKIKDKRFLRAVYSIIESCGGGLAIGYYICQWLANFYLEPLDRYIMTLPGVKYMTRYMDNITLLGPNKKQLHKARKMIAAFMQRQLGLSMKANWQIYPTAKRMVSAVGYRFSRTHIILRKRNFLRFTRQCRRVKKRLDAGKPITFAQASGLLSRAGQLKHCNSQKIREKYIDPIGVRNLKEVVRNESKRRQCTQQRLYAGGAA